MSRPPIGVIVGVLASWALAGCDHQEGNGGSGGTAGDAGGDCASVPTYAEVRSTILTPRCAGRCHGGSGGLTPSPAGPINLSASSTRTELVNRDSVLGMGLVLVRPGDPQGSFLMDKLTNHLPADGSRGNPMPQGEAIAWRMIPQAELDQIRCWIAGGAP